MVFKTLYCYSCGKFFKLDYSNMDRKTVCIHCGSNDFISAYKIGKNVQSSFKGKEKEDSGNKEPNLDKIQNKIDGIRK